jgi:hypothetical protein
MSIFGTAPGTWTVGAGTLQTNAGSALITASPSASTAYRDLVVLMAYVTGAGAPVLGAVDAGDGWFMLDRGWDGTNNWGVLLAGCIAPRAGASGWAGITLPGSGAWTAQTYTYRLPYTFRFALELAAPGRGWVAVAGSSTTSTVPQISLPYPQCLVIDGIGYNNGGTTTTCGNITGFTERFDTGQTSPPHGVKLDDALIWGNDYLIAQANSTLGAAKTNKGGLRAAIPILGHTRIPNRFMSSRRIS